MSRETPTRDVKTLSRRSFLCRTATAAAAVPILGPRIGRAAGRPDASDRVTIGVIGAGKRGHTLTRQLLGYPEVQIVATAEVVEERREDLRSLVEKHYSKDTRGTYRGCAEYVDFRELLARGDIDAVVIATPDHWHAIPVIRAAKAKKDIYCEKPLSLTIHEARAMADAVKEAGIVFQTGSQQRSECEGRFHRACELVRNGRIGKTREVHVGVGGPSRPCDLPEEPIPAGTDWNFWLGPASKRGYHHELCPKGVHDHYPAWRNYQEYSGGGMTDWGAHHFDIVQWGLGMDDSGPVEIWGPGVDGHETLTYLYPNGVPVYHGGADGVRFTGTDGEIEVNRGFLRLKPESLGDEKIGDGEVKLYKASSHFGNWLECVRTRKDPICTAEIGCRSVTVCHLGNLAWWRKRHLRWDPKAFRFVGDAEANEWLDRPRREPWTKLG